jgi:tetratricopeptide (TPR) repeat protein
VRREGGETSRAVRLGLFAALALLIAVALGVVFVLPDRVAAPETQAARSVPAPQARPGAAAQRPAPPVSEAARHESEAVLGEALRLRARAQASGVALWGGATLSEARAALAAGDAAFGRGDFPEARRAYAEAGARFQDLLGRRSQVHAQALAEGERALARGDAAAAQERFDVALAIEPEDAIARLGRERSRTIEAVLALFGEAVNREAAGDLGGAVEPLERALAMDPHFTRAAEALVRVQASIAERDFRGAMSDALAALEGGHLAAARAALARARSLRPGDAALADAARRLTAAERDARLVTLHEQARVLERDERWREAAATYTEALAIDPHAAFAVEARTRAEGRARLYEAIDAHLASPDRLAHDGPFADARSLLGEAEAVDGAGPGLERRLARLREVLAAARAPVPVVIRSDGLTDVTLHRVGRFGALIERTVSLRPGRYVAQGTRTGYRDVRREFTVAAGESPPVILVRCEEPI